MLKRWMQGMATAATVGLAVACGGGGGGGDSLFGEDGGGNGNGNGAGGGGPVSDVSNGVPSQRSMSIAVETYNLDWSINGDTTSVSVRVTDTAGNPVPVGSRVQFSTEGGQIQTSCELTGVSDESTEISECSVTFATQNVRPADGLVSIVAWLEGQEAFVDLNGNGGYEAGEPFYDTGRLFRDDNESEMYEANVDELIVGESGSSALGLGTVACGAKGDGATLASFGFDEDNEPLSVDDTCDGSWGQTLVRARTVLPLSDPRTLGGEYADGSLEVFTLLSLDRKVAAPAGTALSVATAPENCTVTLSPPTVLSNAIFPTSHTVIATGTGCAGQAVQFKLAFGGYEALVPGTLP